MNHMMVTQTNHNNNKKTKGQMHKAIAWLLHQKILLNSTKKSASYPHRADAKV